MNIGSALASGLFAGLTSALYFRFGHNKFNQLLLKDSYGVKNIFITSFVGTFAIAPIILASYYDRNWILTTFEVSNYDSVGLTLVNGSIAGWILIYVGISIGIGSISGLIASLFLSILKNNYIYGFFNH